MHIRLIKYASYISTEYQTNRKMESKLGPIIDCVVLVS